MKRLLGAVATCILAITLAHAAPPANAKARNEVTFSAALSDPNTGPTSWAATGELLFPALGPVLIGPSLSIFDNGDGFSGNAIGAAAELNTGKFSGLFFGAAVHKLNGDVADVADYDGEARVGLKFGGTGFFVKTYASRLWTRAASGATTAPDSTNVVIGIGGRWGN